MKLIEFHDYSHHRLSGWGVDILKFKRYSLIQIGCDEAAYRDWPSISMQFGPRDAIFMSLGLVKFYLTITLWGRHYDD